MENIFTKVYFYVNLKGKKISEFNERLLKDIVMELKEQAQKLVEERLEDDKRKGE